MEKKSLRERFIQWTNKLLGTQPELLDDGTDSNKKNGIEKMINDEDNGISDFQKSKDDIEYWKDEITKYTQFIQSEKDRLQKNISNNTMTPLRYDTLMLGIEKAIHSIEFAQKSLEKLLILKATTPEQIQKVKQTAQKGLNDQLNNRDKDIEIYTQFKKTTNMYATKNNILQIVKKINASHDSQIRESLYQQLKEQYGILKGCYKEMGIDKNYELETENYELFAKTDKFRKAFIDKAEIENAESFAQIQKDAKSILKIKGNHSIEFIQKTIDNRLLKKQSEKTDIYRRLNYLLYTPDEEILTSTTLGIYGKLYEDSEKLATSISSLNNKNYVLSPELENTINENSSNSKKGFTKIISDSLSKDAKQRKLDLVFAMYPFLKGEENKDKLTQYLKQNKTFITRLMDSGVTPEQLIEEKQRLEFLRNTKARTAVAMADATISLENNKKLTYRFVKNDIKLSLTGNQIENIQKLPLAQQGEQKQSYIRRITEEMKSNSHSSKANTNAQQLPEEMKQNLKLSLSNMKANVRQRLSNVSLSRIDIADIKEKGTSRIKEIFSKTNKTHVNVENNPVNVSEIMRNKKSHTENNDGSVNISEIMRNKKSHTENNNGSVNVSEIMRNKKSHTENNDGSVNVSEIMRNKKSHTENNNGSVNVSEIMRNKKSHTKNNDGSFQIDETIIKNAMNERKKKIENYDFSSSKQDIKYNVSKIIENRKIRNSNSKNVSSMVKNTRNKNNSEGIVNVSEMLRGRQSEENQRG